MNQKEISIDLAVDTEISKNIEQPSRIDCIQLRGREFFVKRDDLVDPLLSGNKSIFL